MDYIRLGKSDLEVSQLGFGCCPMGGHGWGKVSEDDLMKAVTVALDNGINFFDTADVYGFGESEKRLGKALKGRRHEAVIATKFGLKQDARGKTYYDNSPLWINCALEGSLRRLGVDCIDLYQLHYWDGKTPLSDIIDVLEHNRVSGKIRYYGLSNMLLKDINTLALHESMISFQLEYSLANRSNEQYILELVEKTSMGFVSWGSLGQGVLCGKYDRNSRFCNEDRRSRPVYVNLHGDKLEKNMKIVEEMKRISKAREKSLSAIAIRWILDYLGFGVVLAGIKNPEQILQNTGAFGWRLNVNDINSLNSVSN
jgi:aryl-alcohol dehydrogenase-like predicted oxidoreductase